MDLLNQLRNLTTVVADTGDFESMKQYKPLDATTNPSLIYQASKDPRFSHLIDEAIQKALASELDLDPVETAIDNIFVLFAKKILEVVPGRVSIEVDASLSFDTEKTLAKAHKIISMMENMGIKRERILIKLATTWEGIQAAKELEKEAIHCNMTLVFNLSQAIACGQVNATLISPFVGRIVDWYKSNGENLLPCENDPGVLASQEMYHYYKKFDIPTKVMAASLRTKEQAIELAGCDLMTIPLNVLDDLAQTTVGFLEKKLDPATSKTMDIEQVSLSEGKFRFLMNQDPMASEKLSDGIRRFVSDMEKLKTLLAERINTISSQKTLQNC